MCKKSYFQILMTCLEGWHGPRSSLDLVVIWNQGLWIHIMMYILEFTAVTGLECCNFLSSCVSPKLMCIL